MRSPFRTDADPNDRAVGEHAHGSAERIRGSSYRYGRLMPPAPLFKCALHSLWRRDIRAPRFLTSAFLKMALKGF
jgi:hypothetical protein